MSPADWLGATNGHVRAMLIAVVVRGVLAALGLILTVAQFADIAPALDSPNWLLWLSLAFGILALSLSALGFWGTIHRKNVGKWSMWALLLLEACNLGVITVFACVFVFCAIPNLLVFFFLLRGLLSADLRSHYRNSYY